MLLAEDIHLSDVLCHADAEHLADQWNTAYPLMRAVANRYIEATRKAVEDKVWEVDQTKENAEILRAFTATEPELRSRLKRAEDLRRALGQLDRAAYKGCTRSPGSFSITGAYLSVRSLLRITSLGTAGLSPAYRLAATLADAEDRLNSKRAELHR